MSQRSASYSSMSVLVFLFGLPTRSAGTAEVASHDYVFFCLKTLPHGLTSEADCQLPAKIYLVEALVQQPWRSVTDVLPQRSQPRECGRAFLGWVAGLATTLFEGHRTGLRASRREHRHRVCDSAFLPELVAAPCRRHSCGRAHDFELSCMHTPSQDDISLDPGQLQGHRSTSQERNEVWTQRIFMQIS